MPKTPFEHLPLSPLHEELYNDRDGEEAQLPLVVGIRSGGCGRMCVTWESLFYQNSFVHSLGVLDSWGCGEACAFVVGEDVCAGHTKSRIVIRSAPPTAAV